MKAISQMNLGELAAYVCSHLDCRGIKVVLSGGGCVAIYASDRYSSMDLDFIDRLHTTRRQLKAALEEIDFREQNRYFVHPETQFFLEFPSGPLAVGSEPVAVVEELHLETGTLRLLSATDCVKDRLAAFYYWNAGSAFSRRYGWLWSGMLTGMRSNGGRDRRGRWINTTYSGSEA